MLPGFALDDGNVPAVMRICQALDGMPLAIELAAPWLRTLPPAQLAERLDDRFALLTGGSRTALPRHQTLRAVIDWSWNLLSEPERVLARRLAVFPGGATLAAAEQVCPDGPLARDNVLPALSGLVAKSILSAADGAGERGPRYRMLETVRAYGLERLAEAGEETAVRDAMAAYYLDFAETADPLLRTGAAADLVPRADRGAGQHQRRAAVGDRAAGRGHRAAASCGRSASTGRSAAAAKATR